MKIAFIGHRDGISDPSLEARLRDSLRGIVAAQEKVTFFFGGYGEFDARCASVCRGLKREFGGVELIYVTPYLTQTVKLQYIIKEGLYDEISYPPLERVPPRLAILKRNEWMLSQADLIFAYVSRPFGGAYKGLCYAKRKGKEIVNLALSE